MSNKKQSAKDKEKKDFQWKQAGKTSFIWIAIILEANLLKRKLKIITKNDKKFKMTLVKR